MSRILIAEDEPHIVRFLVKGLQAQGYATAHTADGNQVLLMARTGQFDLLLLDLGLPGRDGLDVLAELRAEQARLPVIVITAKVPISGKSAGARSGPMYSISRKRRAKIAPFEPVAMSAVAGGGAPS